MNAVIQTQFHNIKITSTEIYSTTQPSGLARYDIISKYIAVKHLCDPQKLPSIINPSTVQGLHHRSLLYVILYWYILHEMRRYHEVVLYCKTEVKCPPTDPSLCSSCLLMEICVQHMTSWAWGFLTFWGKGTVSMRSKVTRVVSRGRWSSRHAGGVSMWAWLRLFQYWFLNDWLRRVTWHYLSKCYECEKSHCDF